MWTSSPSWIPAIPCFSLIKRHCSFMVAFLSTNRSFDALWGFSLFFLPKMPFYLSCRFVARSHKMWLLQDLRHHGSTPHNRSRVFTSGLSASASRWRFMIVFNLPVALVSFAIKSDRPCPFSWPVLPTLFPFTCWQYLELARFISASLVSL